jgi:hypothetical protein
VRAEKLLSSSQVSVYDERARIGVEPDIHNVILPGITPSLLERSHFDVAVFLQSLLQQRNHFGHFHSFSSSLRR